MAKCPGRTTQREAQARAWAWVSTGPGTGLRGHGAWSTARLPRAVPPLTDKPLLVYPEVVEDEAVCQAAVGRNAANRSGTMSPAADLPSSATARSAYWRTLVGGKTKGPTKGPQSNT